MSGKVDQYIARMTGHVKMIYSPDQVKTTVSSTRYDTESRGINHILFCSNGALTSVTDTKGFIVGVTGISSSSTFGAGVVLYLRNAKKVKCSSHGSQMIYLNS